MDYFPIACERYAGNNEINHLMDLFKLLSHSRSLKVIRRTNLEHASDALSIIPLNSKHNSKFIYVSVMMMENVSS